MDKEELQAYAENYFSNTSFLNRRILEDICHVKDSYEEAWKQLDQKEQEQVLNEQIIHPEVMLKYNQAEKEKSKSKLQSFPRLKIRSGQKFIVEEKERSHSQCGEAETYSYRDEHSSPFSWKTRSQQNLNFELYNSRGSSPEKEESAEGLDNNDSNDHSGLDVVAARRSAILSCPFGQYSRVPKVSKPVSIPVVPRLNPSANKDSSDGSIVTIENIPVEHRKEDSVVEVKEDALVNNCAKDSESVKDSESTKDSDSVKDFESVKDSESVKDFESFRDLESVTSMVSSIVIEQDNGIVLDFSCSSSPCSTLEYSAPSTARSESSSLMSRVKDKTALVRNKLTPTLRRKKSITSTDTLSTTVTDYDPDSPTNLTPRVSPNRVMKPSFPPPPPPSRPLNPPPAPPPPSTRCRQPSGRGSIPPPAPPTRDPATRISTRGESSPEELSPLVDSLENNPSAADIELKEARSAKEETDKDDKIKTTDKKVISKTGFDFLDDW